MKFYAWINLLMAEDCDKTIVSLVRAKFDVSADEREIPRTTQRRASTILYLILDSEKITEVPRARDIIAQALEEAKIKHFGILVTSPVECAWNKTNIDMVKATEERKEKILRSAHQTLVPNEPSPNASAEELPDEPA